MSQPATYLAFVEEVAALLCVDAEQLGADDSLLDFGLDSLRLMSLVERMRAEGLSVTFEQLAELPTLRGLARHFGLVP